MKINPDYKDMPGRGDDLEASEEEFNGVAYTGVSLLAFLIVIIGSVIYLL